MVSSSTELCNSPFEPRVRLKRQEQRHAAAERVSDQSKIVEVAVEDELREELRLIGGRITVIEWLVGLAEPLEIDSDDPMVAGEVGRDVTPGETVGAEAVDEQHGRTLAPFHGIEPHRRVRRTKPGERPIACVSGARASGGKGGGANSNQERRQAERPCKSSSLHER